MGTKRVQVEILKYKKFPGEGPMIKTECPYPPGKEGVKIGSMGCSQCGYFVTNDPRKKLVMCAYKMDINQEREDQGWLKKASEKMMKPQWTHGGFQYLYFGDSNGNRCTLQQSSSIDLSKTYAPMQGSSLLWLGKGDHRMHLSRDLVKELIWHMLRWLINGWLFPKGPKVRKDKKC